MLVTSQQDINDIVPMDLLQNNGQFYDYVCDSNDK